MLTVVYVPGEPARVISFRPAKRSEREAYHEGSKMTSAKNHKPSAASARGSSKSDWARIRREAAEGIEPAQDEDSPDATALIREAIAKRRVGRPVGSNKESTTIRFDSDVLNAFRSAGPGWQSRMNAALRDWLKKHSPV